MRSEFMVNVEANVDMKAKRNLTHIVQFRNPDQAQFLYHKKKKCLGQRGSVVILM